jgi:phytanoyl-CoA hydroxylase
VYAAYVGSGGRPGVTAWPSRTTLFWATYLAGRSEPRAMKLNANETDAFRRDGYLVLSDLVDPVTCAALRHQADALVAAFEPDDVASIFSTTNQQQATDLYFLESGGAVRCFFEEEAFDATGALQVPKSRAINKIGHALHDLDPVFAPFSRSSAFEDIVTTLGVAEPLLLQSMYIFKQPSIGGEVVWHQDATFLYTDPVSAIGLWVALEDADIENGCLWALPGGHLHGLKRRFKRGAGGATFFDEMDDVAWRNEDFVPLEVRAGTVVVLDGSLPHGSRANRSIRSRHAYTLHVIDREAKYPSDNWLHRPANMPLRGFGSQI